MMPYVWAASVALAFSVGFWFGAGMLIRDLERRIR